MQMMGVHNTMENVVDTRKCFFNNFNCIINKSFNNKVLQTLSGSNFVSRLSVTAYCSLARPQI